MMTKPIGVNIVKRALEEPARQLALNAGHEGAIVVGRVRESKEENFGFNAETGEFGDLVKAGVIDPAKVTRLALQNAASIAALMLTTEALIADIKEDDKKAAAAPGGGPGGMGECTKPFHNLSQFNTLQGRPGRITARGALLFFRTDYHSHGRLPRNQRSGIVGPSRHCKQIRSYGSHWVIRGPGGAAVMPGLLSKILPRETTFFDLFVQQAENVHQAAIALVEGLEHFQGSERQRRPDREIRTHRRHHHPQHHHPAEPDVYYPVRSRRYP